MHINDELEEFYRDRISRGDPLPRAELRPYQQELSEISIRENTIVFLGTGCGKTFISVMLINSAEISSQIVQENKRIVFLAPTQDLTKQQAQYLQKQTRYRCKVYCGRSSRAGRHIDVWTREMWEQEFANIEAAVMTAQIFANAISTNILDWEKFAVVIFDEGHHIAPTKNNKESKHAYSQIMRHYGMYYQNKATTHPRPRLLILTASLINCMPKKRDNICEQVRYLERMYQARCRTNLEVQSSLPRFLIFSYDCDRLTTYNDTLVSVFTDIKDRLQEALQIKKASRAKTKIGNLNDKEITMLKFLQRLKLSAAGYSIKPKQFPDIFEGLIKVRQRLGVWTLFMLVKLFAEAVAKINGLTIKEASMIRCYDEFIKLLTITKSTIESVLVPAVNPPNQPDLLLGTASSKMRALLDLLKREYLRSEATQTQFSCIVFLRSRLETVGLASWMKQVAQHCPDYHFLRPDFAIGMAAAQTSKYSCVTKRTSEQQMTMLNNFRESRLNVILTTSVLEEGIDLPVCSTVIRYDTANNLREYIQSRGRARKSESSYISLCEFGKQQSEIIDRLNMFNDMELALMEYFKIGNSGSISPNLFEATPIGIEDRDETYEPNDRVCITTPMAATLLSMYFYYSAKGAPYVPQPQVVRAKISSEPVLIQSTLYLPSGCTLREGIKGNPKSNVKDADGSAALEAIKKLHELNEIDENCVPFRVTPKNIDKELSKLKVLPEDVLAKAVESDPAKEEPRQEFIPKMREMKANLVEHTMSKTYSVFGLKFISVKVRDDMSYYFEPMVIGIITDISSQELTKVIPPRLYNHYGTFEIRIVEMSNKLVLNLRDHNYYLDYMLRYLRRCFGMNNIQMNSLKNHCPFYIVPLKRDAAPGSDPGKIIDESAMRDSYKIENSRRDVHSEHIVIMSRNIVRERQTSFYLVDEIISHMSPHSQHVDISAGGITFAEYAKRQYGLRHVEPNQCIVRVRPLSNDASNFRDCKKIKSDYKSTPIHFLQETIEYFHSDPHYHLQSFCLPPIMYRFFQIKATQQVVDDIMTGSKEPSSDNRGDERVPVEPMDIDDAEERNLEHVKMESDCNENDIFGGDEISDHLDEESEEFDDSDQASDSDNSSDARIHDHLRLQPIDCDDHDREFFRWNPEDYQATKLRKITYDSQVHSSNMFYCYNDKFTNFDNDISKLGTEISPVLDNLIDAIHALESKLTTDQDLPDDNQLEKDDARVDKSVQDEMKLDVFSLDVEQSKIEPMLKAFTLRRARDLFDLERYENVGDSFLKISSSIYLYNRLDGKEGLLSQLRSSLVSNARLCELASRKKLGNLAVTRSCDVKYLSYLFGGNIPEDKLDQFNNRLKSKDLADIFEAIVGSQLIHYGHAQAFATLRWLGLNLVNDAELKSMVENQKMMISASSVCSLDSAQASQLRKLACTVRNFENIIDYKFEDKRHIVQAFTHPTCISNKVTRSYQRLEFLGDAILDYLVTRHIFQHDSSLQPGQITDIRAALVNNYTFARLALRHKYDLYIMQSQQVLLDELNRVRAIANELAESKLEIGFVGLLEFDEIVKLLADIFESVAGAIFLDSGSSLDTVWSIYYPIMKDTIEKELQEPTKNPIRYLHELFSAPGMLTFEKMLDLETDHRKTMVCRIKGLGEFRGVGYNYNDAKLRSALNAIEHKPSQEEIASLILKQNRLYESGKMAQQSKKSKFSAPRGRGGRSRSDRMQQPLRPEFPRPPDNKLQNRSNDNNWRKR